LAFWRTECECDTNVCRVGERIIRMTHVEAHFTLIIVAVHRPYFDARVLQWSSDLKCGKKLSMRAAEHTTTLFVATSIWHDSAIRENHGIRVYFCGIEKVWRKHAESTQNPFPTFPQSLISMADKHTSMNMSWNTDKALNFVYFKIKKMQLIITERGHYWNFNASSALEALRNALYKFNTHLLTLMMMVELSGNKNQRLDSCIHWFLLILFNQHIVSQDHKCFYVGYHWKRIYDCSRKQVALRSQRSARCFESVSS